MDKSKIYLAIVFVGCVFLFFGFIRILSNLNLNLSEDELKGVQYSRDIRNENLAREYNRKGAYVLFIIGGTIIVVGFIIKPKQKEIDSKYKCLNCKHNNEPSLKDFENGFYFCKLCHVKNLINNEEIST